MVSKILAGGIASVAGILLICIGLAFESLVPAAIIFLITSVAFVPALLLCIGAQIGVFLLFLFVAAGFAWAFS